MIVSPTARPYFLITIDTEGDNLWAGPEVITTRNAQFLPRFQTLCERYGFKPTYVTTFEMAQCPDYQAFGRDMLRRGTGEIGMHLHAWNSPPIAPLTPNDNANLPYLIEFPPSIMRDKIQYLTGLLEDTFGTKMVSHRAGRWSFNASYAQMLADEGYTVDCSVTPHISWQAVKGDPAQTGGTDFRAFPTQPYFLDLDDISRPGTSSLLEVPMTIIPSGNILSGAARVLPAGSLPRRAVERFLPSVLWLRPNGRNLRSMLRILDTATQERQPYVEFMLHSSEFMAGGSPYFRTEKDIENLYSDLEQLFAAASDRFQGATLAEFFHQYTASIAAG